MINVWELSPTKKEVKAITLDQYRIGKTLSWINAYDPTDETYASISQKTGIPIEELKGSVQSFKRPNVVPFDDYSLIVFRAPYEEDRQKDGFPGSKRPYRCR